MNPNVEKFVDNLKKKYKSRLINREKQWPCRQSSRLVRLQLVHREKAEGSYTSIQRGKEDKRTSLAYCDLFKGESGKNEPVRKVLIEGGAGIGKTTLTISLSEDWACDKLFQEFELVLLLPLRHKKVASASSLPELLKLLHSSLDVCESVSSYLVEEEAEKVLIIADGWDELSESQRIEGSFLYELLFEEFPLMSVVVTSRPSVSASLHNLPILDRFVDIKGFNNDDIIEYIWSEFASDQEKAQRLLEQLRCNPLIESVCSVPLNCSIVCHLWDTLEEAFPSTMTQLYTRIILHVTCRNLRKLSDYGPIFSMASFNDLPKDLQKSWWLLCEFAFKALEKDQIVFTKQELVEFFPESDEQFLCFGLLQSVETVLDLTCVVSFNFLHLTFMEYLAALHLSRQPLDRILEIFKTKRFAMVVRFFFGIKLCYNCESIVSFAKQAVRYVARSDKLSVCHCALEAQNDFVTGEAIQCLLSMSFIYGVAEFGYPSNPHDCAAILYAIANMQECKNLNIDFNNCGVRENQIITLTDALARKHGKLQVKKLNLRGNKLTVKTVSYLFNRASAAFQSLTVLNLSGISIGGESIKSISTALAKTSSSGCRLSVLSLSANPLGVSGLWELENLVCDSVLSNLDQLDLSGSLTDDADTNACWLTTFGEALSAHCPHLRRLDLSDNNLGNPGATALARVVTRLQHHSTKDGKLRLHLTEVHLNQTNLGDKGLCTFVDSLDGVCQFKILLLNDNDIHATGVSCLANAICTGKIVLIKGMFAELKLCDNLLGLEGALAVGKMLSSNHCQLRVLKLSKCKLTTTVGSLPHADALNLGNSISTEVVRDVGHQLCQMPQNNTIVWLVLDGNSFTGNSINILVAFMYLCPGLICLYTSNCEITSDDLIQLLHTLSSLKSSSPSLCSELYTWLLNNNAISDGGVSALIEHLPSLFPKLGYGSGLSIVSLSNNPAISIDMKKKLKEELRRRREVRCYVKQF